MEIEKKIRDALFDATNQSDANPKFGSVIVKDGEIISSGFAHKSSHESDMQNQPTLLIHAEENAILHALNDQVDLSGSDIYVLGVRENGELRISDASYSCVVCSRMLSQTKIAQVVYPTTDGWVKVSVEEMFRQALERVRTGRI